MSQSNNIEVVETSAPIIATDEIQKYLHELRLINKQINDLEDMKSKIKTQIMVFMRNRDMLIDETGLILATWKFTKWSSRFDSKALEKFEPDTYKKYLEAIEPSRRFLIKDVE